MKFCKYCQRDLPLSAFTVRRASPDGLSYKCRECGLTYNSTHYHGSDQVRAAAKNRAKRWAAKNRTRRREIVNAYDARNIERKHSRGRARNRARRMENPEQVRLLGRIAANKRRARVEVAGPMPPPAIVEMILRMARGRCVYCRRSVETLTLDHIAPLTNGGNHSWDNFIPCCKPCNSSKHTRDVADWLYAKQGVTGLADALIFMKSVRKAMRALHPYEFLDLVAAQESR